MSHDIKGVFALRWSCIGGDVLKSKWTIGSTVGKFCTSWPFSHISSFVSPEKHFSGYLTSQNLSGGNFLNGSMQSMPERPQTLRWNTVIFSYSRAN